MGGLSSIKEDSKLISWQWFLLTECDKITSDVMLGRLSAFWDSCRFLFLYNLSFISTFDKGIDSGFNFNKGVSFDFEGFSSRFYGITSGIGEGI